MNRHNTAVLTVGVDFQSAIRSDKSGVGYYTTGMVQALAQRYPDIQIYLHYYNFLNRNHIEIPDLPNVHGVASRLVHPKLVNLLRRFNIEIPFWVLLKKRSQAYFFPSYTTYPVAKNATVITTIHDLAYLEVPDSVSARNRTDLIASVPRALARSSAIATVSEDSKRRIKHAYSKTPPIFVTYSPPAHCIQVAEPVGAYIPKRYILFVGNLEPRKNLVRLLAAYEQLGQTMRDNYAIVIVGGGGWNNHKIIKKIKSMITEGNNVVLTGYVTEGQLVTLYKNAALFV